jgi:urease accessory protein
LIPFRQSVLEQVTRIDVAHGGSLVLGEILTPGRIAMGERGEFMRLHLDVEARYGNRPCLIERARLDPARRPLTSVGRHGEHPIAGTLYLIGERCTLPTGPEIPETVTWASATGDGYTLVRLLGPTVQTVASAMQALLRSAFPQGNCLCGIECSS